MVVIGSWLLTASLDGTVRRWSLKEQDLIAKETGAHDGASTNKEISNHSSGSGSNTGQEKSAAILQSKDKVASKEKDAAQQASVMTEEEERELAELMDSDDDDD